jgi:hypothetical protein
MKVKEKFEKKISTRGGGDVAGCGCDGLTKIDDLIPLLHVHH